MAPPSTPRLPSPDTVLAVPRQIWCRVPEKVLRRRRAFPIAMDGPARLVVAMVDPADLAGVDEIAFAAGLRVVPVPAAPDAVARLIALHLGAGPDAGPEPIDLPEETSSHPLEEWLVPTAPGDTRWR